MNRKLFLNNVYLGFLAFGFILLFAGCSSIHHKQLACSTFSGRAINHSGISRKEMRRLITVSTGSHAKVKRIKNPEKAPQQNLPALSDHQKSSIGNNELNRITQPKAFIGNENGQDKTTAFINLKPEKIDNRDIASSNKSFGLFAGNKRLSVKLLHRVIKESKELINLHSAPYSSAPSASPQQADNSNLFALLSIIFSGSSLLFFIAMLALIYPTIALIMTVGAYLLAIAGIVFGVLGIYRALKLKKKFLGLAIAGSALGLLLLIILIVAALA